MIDPITDREYEALGQELGDRVLAELVVENTYIGQEVVRMRAAKASLPPISDWQGLIVMVDEGMMRADKDMPSATVEVLKDLVFTTDGLDNKGRVLCEVMRDGPGDTWVISPSFLLKVGKIDTDGEQKWGEA